MANIHLLVPSFNAGELSPLLRSRFGVEKVASGCRKLRNFIPHTHGPAFRRPGMEYMGAAMSNTSKSRLAGFNFSTTTGAILEFNPNGLQVWSNGLLVPLINPVPLPYSEAECFELQIAQVNDICYIAHPSHAPRRLVRYADDDWRLEDIEWVFPPLGDENVRDDEVASSVSTGILTVNTENWPEFDIPASATISFGINSGHSGAATKTARLQRWKTDTEQWVTIHTSNWTFVPPPVVPIAVATGGTYRMTFVGPTDPASNVETSWSGTGTGTELLDTSIAQPESQESVSVPAGEWQTTVVCTTVPDGATLWLQKLNGSTWEDVKKLKLADAQTFVTRGTTLEVATTYRFDWRGRAMAGGSASIETLAFPVSTDVTLALSATSGDGVTLTASEAIFQVGHVGTYWQITHRRETAFVEIKSAVPTIVGEASAAIRVDGKYDVYSYGSWAATLYLEKRIDSSSWGVIRSWPSNQDRNVISNGEELEDTELRLRISDGASTAVSGASQPRFLLELADARVNCLVKITAIGALDANGKALTATVDIDPRYTAHSTAATPIWTEGAWSDVKGYPRAVALHGQRLWFGGTEAEPMRLWGSVINDYQDFRRTTRDDAGVSFTPAAQQSNKMQWLASHGQDLVLGSNGDEWTLSGGVDNGPITPTSVNLQRRSAYGSNYLSALLLGDVVIFSQRGGRKLRQVAPRADGIVWSAADLTVLAEHVTKTGIVQMSAMNFPASILWAVTADGRLLGMTFEQEQNVFGWHVHLTDGIVESVAVVFGEDADEVWLAVKRGERRNIERLDPVVFARNFDAPERLIYLDAATRFEFEEATDTLTGLDHLNGLTCDVLGDGAHLQSVGVVDGSAQIERACSTVIIGLPYISELQPMRLEIPLRDGTAQGRQWRVSRVGIDVHDSIGGEIADGPTGRFEKLIARRVSTPTDTAPELQNGLIETAIESNAREGVDVVIRQTAPLPLNIGSIVLKGDVYGE